MWHFTDIITILQHLYFFQLYAAFNITIVLTGIITWNIEDGINFPKNNDATNTLKLFQEYIENNPPPVAYDAILMIT